MKSGIYAIAQSLHYAPDYTQVAVHHASLNPNLPAHFEDVPCQSGVNHIFEG